MAKHKCVKGHIHDTEEKAENCYICKRRTRRVNGKRSKENKQKAMDTVGRQEA